VTGSLYDGMIRVWEVATGKELRRLKGHTDWVLTVAFSRDGRRILSGGMDRTVRLWEAETGKQLRCFTITSDLVAHVAFSPRRHAGRIVRGPTGWCVLWDLRSGRETGAAQQAHTRHRFERCHIAEWDAHPVGAATTSRCGFGALDGHSRKRCSRVTRLPVASVRVFRRTDATRSAVGATAPCVLWRL